MAYSILAELHPESQAPASSVGPAPEDTERTHQAEVRNLEAERDRRLVTRARSGDPRAFEELFRLHRARVYSLAYSYLRDEREAEEVVQEVFLRVHKSLPEFQGSSRFFTWIFRIATNLSIDHLRRPRRREVTLEEAFEGPTRCAEPEAPDPHDELRIASLGARIRSTIEQLPSYHRDVVVMRELCGMSYEEMATTAGVSKGTIMSRLFHARQKLQRALRDAYKEHFGQWPTAPFNDVEHGSPDGAPSK